MLHACPCSCTNFLLQVPKLRLCMPSAPQYAGAAASCTAAAADAAARALAVMCLSCSGRWSCEDATLTLHRVPHTQSTSHSCRCVCLVCTAPASCSGSSSGGDLAAAAAAAGAAGCARQVLSTAASAVAMPSNMYLDSSSSSSSSGGTKEAEPQLPICSLSRHCLFTRLARESVSPRS
jgi:hypothetical protein